MTCHGGIVGNNFTGGQVVGCASKATINGNTGTNGNENFGGVAGLNSGNVENCLYLGSTVVGKQNIGAIVGSNNSGTVRNSYYINGNSSPAIGSNSGTTENVLLAPQDAQDNTGFIALMAARTAALTAVERTPALSTAVDITLAGRTLYKDGFWNTLCLPFDVDLNADGCPLAGAKARTLTSASIEGTTLNLTFGGDVTELKAGTPYIIKWTSGDDIVSPVFTGVTIDATNRDYTSTDSKVSFKGTYAPITWDAENTSILFLGVKDNKSALYYPAAGAGLNSFRAYFELSEGTEARAFNLNFGDGESTGIVDVDYKSTDNESGVTNRLQQGWFDLQGRRLSAKPTTPGLYINNGKKIVIK